MAHLSLFPNDVFQFGGERYRVIHIDVSVGKLYGFPLEGENRLPVSWGLSDLAAAAGRDELKRIDALPSQAPASARAKDLEVGRRRWESIRDLVENHRSELMDRTKRAIAIRAHARRTKVSERQVMKLLRMYWRNGMTQASLMGAYRNCGRLAEDTDGVITVEASPMTGKELILFAPAKGKTRGRRPVKRSYEPFFISRELKQRMLADMRSLFKKDEIVSKRYVIDKIQGKYFALLDPETGEPLRSHDGKRVVLRPPGQRPSNDQLRYLLKKAVPEHESFSSRVSEDSFRNNYARSDGTVHDDTVGPGDVYEVDATILDVWLVSAYHSGVIIGKPTLYLVVDRDTDLIVGFHLTLDKPSWEGAKRAILSIASDWKALCNALHVKYRESDWPAQGVFPTRFFLDRGEGISKKSDVLCDGARIEVTNAPRASPRRKVRAEGSFFSQQVAIKDVVAGYEIPSNAKKRQGKKYSLDASLRLEGIAAVEVRNIVRHNNTLRGDAVVDPRLTYDGFEATPINIWQHKIATSMGRVTRHTYDFMRQQLLPRDTARVLQSGIVFEKLTYSFDGSRFDALCALAARGARIEVTVQYDRANVGKIWVTDPDNPTIQYEAKLTSRWRELDGRSFAEVAHYQDALDKAKDKAKEANQGVRIAYQHDADQLTRDDRARAKAASRGLRPGTRHRIGVNARALEENARRQTHATNESATSVSVQGFVVPAIDTDHIEDTRESEAIELHLTESHDVNERAPVSVPGKRNGATPPSTQPSLLSGLLDLIQPPSP